MPKVALLGTCNDSKWRDELISMLSIDYFNPVVDDWNEEAQANEIRERKECDYLLYVITPRLMGLYSIAEVTEDSIKQPEKTIFCFLPSDVGDNDRSIRFTKEAYKSLEAIAELVKRNGATVLPNLLQVAGYLNSKK